MLVVAAQNEGLRPYEGAGNAADDGFGGVPARDFEPPSGRGQVALPESLDHQALHALGFGPGLQPFLGLSDVGRHRTEDPRLRQLVLGEHARGWSWCRRGRGIQRASARRAGGSGRAVAAGARTRDRQAAGVRRRCPTVSTSRLRRWSSPRTAGRRWCASPVRTAASACSGSRSCRCREMHRDFAHALGVRIGPGGGRGTQRAASGQSQTVKRFLLLLVLQSDFAISWWARLGTGTATA